MPDLSENWLNRSWVGAKDVPKLCKVGMVKQSSELGNSKFSGSLALGAGLELAGGLASDGLKPCGDAVAKILDCSFGIEESGSECGLALLSGEAHAHKLVDLSFMLLVFRRLSFLLLLFWLVLFLLLLLLFLLGRLYLGLFFGLGGGFGDLVHADHEVGVLDAYFFDGVVVAEGLALEDDLESFCRHALDLLDFCFEDGDLRRRGLTVSAGSTSTWNTSPFRFLIFSFITT